MPDDGRQTPVRNMKKDLKMVPTPSITPISEPPSGALANREGAPGPDLRHVDGSSEERKNAFGEVEYERAVEIARGYGYPSVYEVRRRMKIRYPIAVAMVEEMKWRRDALLVNGCWKMKYPN